MKAHSLRTLFSLAAVALVAGTTAFAEDVSFEAENGEKWTVSVEPFQADTPGEKPTAGDYRAIYKTIPFNRAEYEANPSYRHEATMEILFGQLRPGTKVTIQGDQHKERFPRRNYNYAPQGAPAYAGYYYPYPGYWRSMTIPQVP